MSKSTEVFENEEAAKLLDYFVAYKKLMIKLEYIKCEAALNSNISFSENHSQPANNALNQINDNQPAIGLPPAPDK